MPPTNDILQFCSTDTGTNLLTESEYAASSDRTSGNKPGIASAKLVNRALRQAAYIASQFSQFVANGTGTDVLDDATPAKLLAQITSQLTAYPPVVTQYLTGSGTHNLSYIFRIASGSATAGATYTNSAVTFTVKATVASGLFVTMSGSGAPAASGTLTKASGTGDATLTFYSVRAPLYLVAELIGGGGGGGGGAAVGGNGGNTTFGGVATASGGTGGDGGGAINGGAGGGAALTTSATVMQNAAVSGGKGTGGTNTTVGAGFGGAGGNGFFGGGGGGGAGGPGGGAGAAGAANTGGGGGGGGTSSQSANNAAAGGGAGGYVSAVFTAPSATYAYNVGAGGTGSGSSGSGFAGGAGGTGAAIVREYYQ